MRVNFIRATIITLLMKTLLLLLVFIGGCSSVDPEFLNIGVGTGLTNLPLWVAQDNGFFLQEGLTVSVEEFASGKDAMNTMLDGTVDISLTASLPIVLKSFERNDFIVLASFVSSSHDIKVLGTGKSISDLKGKKVGLPIGTTPQFLMETCLDYHKLTGVEIVDVRSQDALNELKNDNVDAVAVWQPYAFEIEQAMDVTDYCSEVYYRSTLSFVGLKHINKEAVRRFLEAIHKANTFIREHPEEAKAIARKHLQLDKNVIDELVHYYNYQLFLDEQLLQTFEREAKWTKKSPVPDYRAIVYTDTLLTVEPNAVNIN